MTNRNDKDFGEINQLELYRVFSNNLFNKVQAALKEALEVNASLPNDYPNWKGRFREEEVFIKKEIFGKTYNLCNSGRENCILFLSNIFDSLNKDQHSELYEIMGDNHSEIQNVYERFKI